MIKVRSSGATSGTIVTGPGLLFSVTVTTDGTNDGQVIVYDNTAASGTVLAACKCAGDQFSKTVSFFPISASNGIHYTVTGTGASGIITYSTDRQSFN